MQTSEPLSSVAVSLVWEGESKKKNSFIHSFARIVLSCAEQYSFAMIVNLFNCLFCVLAFFSLRIQLSESLVNTVEH